MQRHNYRPKQSSSRALRPVRKPQFLLNLRDKPPVPLWLPEGPYRQSRQFFKLSDLLVVFSLFLATLACTCSAYAFGQTNALAARTSAVGQISWPTSTRTPLPTLTPTLTQAQVAGTSAPPVPVNAPVPPAPPVSTAPLLTAALPPTTTVPSSGVLPSLPAANSSELNLQPLNPVISGSIPPTVTQIATAGAVTFVPTSSATGTITLPTLSPNVPTATAIPGPTATSASPATPTVMPTPATGWSFASVRVYPGQADGMLLYGNMINDTGASQELEAVTGSFYDAEGQLIAGEGSTYDYWPINVVPSGGSVPFELTVFDVQNAANFDLAVEAVPSGENTRQDFEFLNVNQRNEDGDYCLGGELRNPGDELKEYLVIVAILYDAQGNVINFDYYDEYDPENVKGDQTSSFDICVSPLDQGVANHELRAWGQ